MAIPAFFRFTDVTEFIKGITILFSRSEFIITSRANRAWSQPEAKFDAP